MGALTQAGAGRWSASAPRLQAVRVWLVLGWVAAIVVVLATGTLAGPAW